MAFTDIFIRRPVLATVVSLVILLLGLRAGMDLTVREYPELQNAQVKVTVVWPGAEPKLIEGFVTTPLEREIASVDGIDFLNSSTGQGSTVITANLKLEKNPNDAMAEIASKVNKLRSQLPGEVEDPVIELSEGSGIAAMYQSFYSDVLSDSQITDYLIRVVEPQLASLPGIANARIIGAKTFAMRIWLRPESLVEHNLTAGEALRILRRQSPQTAVGESRGHYVKIGLSARTDLRTVEEYRDMVIRAEQGATVRLSDIADVVLGADNYDQAAGWNGSPAIFIGIEVRPEANVLDVISGVRELWPDIVSALPEGLDAAIGYDSTAYIRQAIAEVRATLVEAVAIVIAVIFLFLGSLRSSLIPAVTVPLSLVGALFGMYLMGYSINLLTLLAMVLAIGMVVDDAIIVLENIHRHIEEGMAPTDAALQGARELVGPVVAMTLTLVAVFAPIGFMEGVTGTLFSEFAFTLAGAVLISGIVALTLTPMMCARILSSSDQEGQLEHWLNDRFDRWRISYQKRLHSAMDTPVVVGLFGLLVLIAAGWLFTQLPDELAPREDRGFVFGINETDGFSSQDYLDEATAPTHQMIVQHPDVSHMFTFAAGTAGSTNRGFMGFIGDPWEEREKSMKQIIGELMPQVGSNPSLRTYLIEPPPLPTPGQGYPIEFVVKGAGDALTLQQVGNEIIGRAMQTGKFMFLTPRVAIDRPETVVQVQRERAAAMGVNMDDLGADLSSAMAGARISRFSNANRSYDVIAQVKREARLNPRQVGDLYTRAGNGELVPLSSIVTFEDRVVPRVIEHMQQLAANVIIGVPAPGATQGEVLSILEEIANEVMPAGYQVDYAGPSRQYKQEGDALTMAFVLALIVIYLVLAAQFESFRDPIIMLVTVPMSICGALLFLYGFQLTNALGWTQFPGMTLNIYTKVGLLTLVGVISKHGILIVEFANQLQVQGRSKRQAIEEATAIRMRPILMTTAALVVAMIPLLISSGPGAAARFSMGLVIASGMTVGTLFTLYVVPAMYLFIGRDMGNEPKDNVDAALSSSAGQISH